MASLQSPLVDIPKLFRDKRRTFTGIELGTATRRIATRDNPDLNEERKK